MQDVGLPGKLGTEWMSVGGGGFRAFGENRVMLNDSTETGLTKPRLSCGFDANHVCHSQARLNVTLLWPLSSVAQPKNQC